MNTIPAFPPRRPPTITQPLPALEYLPIAAAETAGDAAAVNKMLARLMHDESALYAITREWRYDAATRKFVRLHRLLDEQYSEIGVRLARLAARSRDLGASHSTRSGKPAPAREGMAAGALQTPIIRQLLSLHETLLARLKRGTALVGGPVRHDKTTALLADLTAEHEKDAFMLRALLWEVQKTAA